MSPQIPHLLRRPGRYVCLVTALGFTVMSLICLVVVLVSGLKTPNGKLGRLSFVVIDCSKVEVNIYNKTFHGLPDTNDFSKHKDFYALYLWTYCSGAIRDSGHYIDFCSKSHQSLHDLFGFWKVWGASVHKEGTRFYWLERGPRQLYAVYLTAASITILEILASLSSLYTIRVSRGTVVLSSFAFASLLTTATLAQVTYDRLINRAEEDDMPTTAKKGGQILYAANWMGTAFSFFSLVLRCHVFKGNAVKRAATIETTSHTYARTTSADSPILDRTFVETPIRKRTFSKWVLH